MGKDKSEIGYPCVSPQRATVGMKGADEGRLV